MGADFLFWTVPAPELTPERQAELRRLADAATLEEDEEERYEDVSEWRQALHAALDCLTEGRRDMCCWSPAPGNPLTYPVFLTGGLSWGDSPTEAADHFEPLARHDGIWNFLLKWAQEDWRLKAGEQRPSWPGP